MNTTRNSYFFGRVVVWCRAGAIPSVTVASSTLQVDELAYRMSPVHEEWISRHYSEVVNLETFSVSSEMLDRIRLVFARLHVASCADENESIERNSGSSNWFFQPKDDGWFAMYNGGPKDIHAFHGWLSEILT